MNKKMTLSTIQKLNINSEPDSASLTDKGIRNIEIDTTNRDSKPIQ